MPTYEYHCDACEHNFDEFQSMMDKPLKKCPKCKKQKLRRIFGTGAAILFKGSGFYCTDYRSDSYTAGAKADKESSEKASTSATDKPAADGKADTSSSKNGSSGTKAKGKGSTPAKAKSDD